MNMSGENSIWLKCKRLIIVFPFRDEENFKNYRIALDKLLNESNVQELKIIVTLPESVKKEDLKQHKLIHYFSAKEISFFGKIKNPEMNNIIVQPYDIMLCLEDEDRKISKFLSKVHVTWKIGVNVTQDFYTIKVNCKSQIPSEIVNFAKNTLEKITSCELSK